MTRAVPLALALATLLSAGPVLADQSQARRPQPTVQRVVMECGRDDATQRGFRREHGARPVFVTAEQVLSARASGDGWRAPRCMTARERGRLARMMSERAGGR